MNHWLELEKCSKNYVYFIEKFTNLKLYPFQKKFITEVEENRFNIAVKFRNSGLSTLSYYYGLWKCLFKDKQTICLFSCSAREAKFIQNTVREVADETNIKFINRYNEIYFPLTDSHFYFLGADHNNIRGRAPTHIILDEPAFMSEIDRLWEVCVPMLGKETKVIAVSTTNGVDNWFYFTYDNAVKKSNSFHAIDVQYWECWDYQDAQYLEHVKASLGEKRFCQEIMGYFITS